MTDANTTVRRFASWAARRPVVRRAALRRSAARNRGLVLLWHRVGPEGPAPHEVVPTVPSDLFRRQVEALGELGDIVALADLDTERDAARPRFALTFDDDDPGHVRRTLPILRELGVPGTFFLSGRWLHGRGPYWWQILEAEIVDEGLAPVARRLGRTVANPVELAGLVEGTPDAARLDARGRHQAGWDLLDGHGARTLAEAGMEVGFHTVDHPVLTKLDDAGVASAVTDGRDELAADISRPVRRLSYPHGKVDARVAGHVAAAGYTSAWSSSQLPAQAGDEPHLRGRWEAGGRDIDGFVEGVLRRLAMPGGLPLAGGRGHPGKQG